MPMARCTRAFGWVRDSPQSSATAVGLTATPGVAVFNPFVGDGGFAERYAAAVQFSDGSWVTTGYGGATGEGVASTLGFKTTEAPDHRLSFKVKGTALDTTYGGDGEVAVQSEGLGLQHRRGSRAATSWPCRVIAPCISATSAAARSDKQWFSNASASSIRRSSEDGISSCRTTPFGAQFFGVDGLSPDGKYVALDQQQQGRAPARGARAYRADCSPTKTEAKTGRLPRGRPFAFLREISMKASACCCRG